MEGERDLVLYTSLWGGSVHAFLKTKALCTQIILQYWLELTDLRVVAM